MNEWIQAVLPGTSDLPGPVQMGQLVRATVLGVLVATVYFLTQKKQRLEAAPFVATLVLLTVLIAMVTQVIGDNVARAFSLAGALAIIRFRTVVDDTRDTAFVIAAVVMGMAVGSDMLRIALAGLPILALAAWGLTLWSRGASRGFSRVGTLVIRTGIGPDPAAGLIPVLEKRTLKHRLVSVATARQGAAIDQSFTVSLRPESLPLAVVAELNRVEGVQSVEWKELG